LRKRKLKIIEHDKIEEIISAYRKEYRFGHQHHLLGLLGFYGVKSNTIHVLNRNVLYDYILAHEHAHYVQRTLFKFKYAIAVQPHGWKIFDGGMGLFLLGGFALLTLGPVLGLLLIAGSFVVMGAGYLADSFGLQLENEADKIAMQKMRKL
jgi:hypothetical protein